MSNNTIATSKISQNQQKPYVHDLDFKNHTLVIDSLGSNKHVHILNSIFSGQIHQDSPIILVQWQQDHCNALLKGLLNLRDKSKSFVDLSDVPADELNDRLLSAVQNNKAIYIQFNGKASNLFLKFMAVLPNLLENRDCNSKQLNIICTQMSRLTHKAWTHLYNRGRKHNIVITAIYENYLDTAYSCEPEYHRLFNVNSPIKVVFKQSVHNIKFVTDEIDDNNNHDNFLQKILTLNFFEPSIRHLKKNQVFVMLDDHKSIMEIL